ncbi:hypothetical protein AB0J71_20025 [Nonomuraea sp. NPDC049637]|uniref:hypothetical protein n=1 Tax=Nonomuraea sp. NPDC049637 TaxID=3154356 RepID=UPI00342D38DC
MRSLRTLAAVAVTLALTTSPAAAQSPPSGRDKPVAIVSDQAGETFTESVSTADAVGVRTITWTSNTGVKLRLQGVLPGSTVRVVHTAPQVPGVDPSAQLAGGRAVGLSITGPNLSKSDLLKYAGSLPDPATSGGVAALSTPVDRNPDWYLVADVTFGNAHVYASYGYWLVNSDGAGNWGVLGQIWHSARDQAKGTEIKQTWQWTYVPPGNWIVDQDPKWTQFFEPCRQQPISVSIFGFSVGGSIYNCRGQVDPWAWANNTDTGVGVSWKGKSGYTTIGGATDFAIYSPSTAAWSVAGWISLIDD